MVRRILGLILYMAVIFGFAACSFDPNEPVTEIKYYNDAVPPLNILPAWMITRALSMKQFIKPQECPWVLMSLYIEV